MTFPITPLVLNYAGVIDKTTYGRRIVDYTKRISDIDQMLVDLQQYKLPRAQEEMEAHRIIMEGAITAGNLLIEEATAIGYTHTPNLRQWDYIYEAGTLKESIFFPWTTGSGQYSGFPKPHPRITFAPSATLEPPPENPPLEGSQEGFGELGYLILLLSSGTSEFTIDKSYINATIEASQALPPSIRSITFINTSINTRDSWGTTISSEQILARIAQLNERGEALVTDMDVVLSEYNLMLKVVLAISEGSIIKVHSILSAIDQLQVDREHTELVQSLSDNSGATNVATKTPVFWPEEDQYADLWRNYINLEDL